jgi:hypothetical protein
VPLTTMLAAWLVRQRVPVRIPSAGYVTTPSGDGAVGRMLAPPSGAPVGRMTAPSGDAAGYPVAPEGVDDRRRRPSPPRRRRDQDVVPDVFTDAKPFSTDDDAEFEWERRLRDSYGLDRRQRGRRRQDD